MGTLSLARWKNTCSALIVFAARLVLGGSSAGEFLPVAEEACRGFGKVTQSGSGTRGAPILILEEIHVSRAAKVENAIALVRLHDLHGLRNIAVEGYLTNGPAMDLQTLRNAAGSLTPTERAEVVSRLLRSGEVGTTTAMALIYEDIQLHPTEAAAEYDVEITGKARSVMTRYLGKIAERSVRPEHLSKLSQLHQQAEAASPQEQAAKAKALVDYFMSLNAFTKEKYSHLSEVSRVATLSLETILEDAQEIQKEAQTLNVQLSTEDREAMSKALAFWKGRIAANNTMADNAGLVADQPRLPGVALCVGAAHTEGVARRFAQQERPFAVIRPSSLDTPSLGIDLDLEMLDEVPAGASLYTEGMVGELLRTYPVDSNQAQPGCNLPWAQAEIELFLFARRMADQAFPGPQRVLKAAVPTELGFTPAQFQGRRVEIDPRLLEVVPDHGPGSPRALLFFARLKPLPGGGEAGFWVKLGVVAARTPAPATVEAALQRCREAILRGPKPGKRLEDHRGRISITDSVLAGFSRTKEAALKIPVCVE